jgi:hypothetical protein
VVAFPFEIDDTTAAGTATIVEARENGMTAVTVPGRENLTGRPG